MNLEFKKTKSILLDIEKQLANRQEHFNTTLRVFNHKCEEFPDIIFAQTLGFSPLDPFIVFEESTKQEDWDLKLAA